MKIAILVKSGTIQEIRCSGHGVDLAVVDLDNLERDEEEPAHFRYGNFPVHHNSFPLRSMVKDHIPQERGYSQ